MRDMNAERASMMKNRPLRNREDKGREYARALNQRSRRDAQRKFRDASNDTRTGISRPTASYNSASISAIVATEPSQISVH
jgi:hypothetical protein